MEFCSGKIIEKELQHMEAFRMDSQHFAWKLEIRDRSIRYDINYPDFTSLEKHNYIERISDDQ